MIVLDFTQWAALWYVGGMISGALVMITIFNSRGGVQNDIHGK